MISWEERMIRTILFDLDNTLLNFNIAERIAVTKALQEAKVPVTEAVLCRYSQLNLEQWKLLEKGQLTRAEVKVRRFRLLFEELGSDASAEDTASCYEKLLAIGHFFIEGAPELLELLKGKYRMYLVTNGTKSVQDGRLASAGIRKYFDDVFVSEEIGYEKPFPEFFAYCFSRIPGFQKEETVIVGDSLTSDILGGINSGIRTVWFHPSEIPAASEIHPDYQIRHLLELPELLDTIIV